MHDRVPLVERPIPELLFPQTYFRSQTGKFLFRIIAPSRITPQHRLLRLCLGSHVIRSAPTLVSLPNLESAEYNTGLMKHRNIARTSSVQQCISTSQLKVHLKQSVQSGETPHIRCKERTKDVSRLLLIVSPPVLLTFTYLRQALAVPPY